MLYQPLTMTYSLYCFACWKGRSSMSSDVIQGEQSTWAEAPPMNPPLRHVIGEVVERQTWLDKLANPIQNALLALFGQPGQPTRKIKDMLNGTWLGHSLHPVLTDVPLGAWSGTMLLDLAWLRNEDEGIARSADLTVALGLLGASGAAVTGLTDWSDLDGTDRRVGLLHGLLNVSVTLTYLSSFVLRLLGKRRPGIALATAGYVTSLFSAYLGGELVFAKGIAVNHVAWEGRSKEGGLVNVKILSPLLCQMARRSNNVLSRHIRTAHALAPRL